MQLLAQRAHAEMPDLGLGGASQHEEIILQTFRPIIVHSEAAPASTNQTSAAPDRTSADMIQPDLAPLASAEPSSD